MFVDSDGEVLFSNMCARHDVRLCVEPLVSSEQPRLCQALPGFERRLSTFILQCTSEQVGIFPTMSIHF